MTDKEIIIQKIIESPQSLSDGEIEQILSDVSLRQCYEAYASFRMANRFKKEQQKRVGLRKYAVAASIVGAILVASASLLFMTHRHDISTQSSPDGSLQMVETAETPTVSEINEPTTSNIKESKIFDNAPLKEILGYIEKTRHCNLNIENEAALELRLYFEIKAGQSLEDIVVQLDTFSSFEVFLENDTITIR